MYHKLRKLHMQLYIQCKMYGAYQTHDQIHYSHLWNGDNSMITAQQTTATRGNRSVFLRGVCHKKHAAKEVCVCVCVQTKGNTVAHGWRAERTPVFLSLWCCGCGAIRGWGFYYSRSSPSFTSFCFLSSSVKVSHCVINIYGHICMRMRGLTFEYAEKQILFT